MQKITLTYDNDKDAEQLFRIIQETTGRQISGCSLGILRDGIGKAEEMKIEKNPVTKAFLVYQGGIANVFAVDCLNVAPFGRNARRLAQSDFRTCQAYAMGLGAAGVTVRTAACNMAGDIIDSQWTEDLESQPFSDKLQVIEEN